jgi:hypothetical protein
VFLLRRIVLSNGCRHALVVHAEPVGVEVVLVLRGRVAAAFAQAVCIASIQVPPFVMVSAMLALHLSLYALRPSSVSSTACGRAGPALVVMTAVNVCVASIYLMLGRSA